MKNQKLFKRYVAPYLWEGWLWCDGGLGPKNEILSNVARPTIDGDIVPLYLHPYNAVRAARVRVQAETADCTAIADERYQVAFPGKHWRSLLKTIEDLRKCGVDEQRWTLTSWLSSRGADTSEAPYRMVVLAGPKKGDEEVRIVQGMWRPCFSEARTVAGWKS